MIKINKNKAISRARKALKMMGYDTSKMTDQEVEVMFQKVGETITDAAKDLKKKAKNFLGGLLK